MAQLSAFVGHSFVEADQEVVSRIITMLRSVAKLMSDFEWDHAQEAEPKVLSQKVLEKMTGKNLFIGICTAKESVIDPAKLRPGKWLRNSQLFAEANMFEAKTSDWIIQEIGMAFGRGMKIVLLMEEGLREPGGLQGDLEYITFKRASPEKCIDKLADMLRSLVPMAASFGESQQSSTIGTTAPDNQDHIVPDFLGPNTSWTSEDYCNRHGLAILIESKSAQDQIFSAFKNSPYSKDIHANAAFEANTIVARSKTQKTEWLEPLQQLTMLYPDTAGPYIALAELFGEATDHARALDYLKNAIRFSTTPEQKMKLLITAAEHSYRTKDIDHTKHFISRCGELIALNPSIEADAMARLAEFWKGTEQTQLFLACAERALELAPDKQKPRFDVAYKYSEQNQETHALFHYRQHLKVSEDPSTWNNLGVSAIANKLPVMGIEAYYHAHAVGHTLATSNLVFALLGAGFLKEATTICDEGLKQSEPHPRLYEAKVRCDRMREEELDKESELLKTTAPQRVFLQAVGRCSVAALEAPLATKWQGSKCEFVATLTDSRLTLTGNYSQSIEGTLSSLLLGHKADIKEQSFTVIYTGILVGRAFIGKVKTTNAASTSSLLTSDDGKECIGILDVGATRFDLLEDNKRQTSLTVVAS